MLELPEVTLCCVDTRTVPLARYSMQQCLNVARFGDAVFLGPQGEQERHAMPPSVRWVDTPPLKGIEDYNRIMLQGLLPHVHTSHLLIVQWDGFIANPAAWRPEFLDWDYVGAPWYHAGHPGMVGNGGFSLRSRRLLEALTQMPLDTQTPEDMWVCVEKRHELEQTYNIRFAPLALAQAFSCEYGPYRPAFGFHSMHNFAYVMNELDLDEWLSFAPNELMHLKHTKKLIKSLSESGRSKDAINLMRRRLSARPMNFDDMLLCARVFLKTLARR